MAEAVSEEKDDRGKPDMKSHFRQSICSLKFRDGLLLKLLVSILGYCLLIEE
jgi:hypothetical protein